MNLPNLLTFLRIGLIPIFIAAFYWPSQYSSLAAAAIFSIAALTDLLDGYFARILNQASRLGAFLDPVADKLIVAIAIVLIVSQCYFPYLAIPSAIIISREIVVSALREWMAELGQRTSVAVSILGKIKTFSQMLALILLLIYKPYYHFLPYMDELKITGYFLFYLAAFLTLWSMLSYLRSAWPKLFSS